MSEVETTESLVSKALAECEPGQTIAVQLHGKTDEPQLARLREKHTVLTVAPYRWTRLGGNDDKVQRLIEAISTRQLDAVTFTSAPAVDALLAASESIGSLDTVVDALRTDVLAAAVGPVTAAPLLARGIAPIQPERFRMGALIRLLCEYLETNRVARVQTRHGELAFRGQLALIGERRVMLPPTSITLLRQLMATPGAVLSRAELASALPGIQDDHAMEVAISRLRQSLGVPGLVATVVKRGYRLDV
jgi:uroporphyrinogen-III synthase